MKNLKLLAVFTSFLNADFWFSEKKPWIIARKAESRDLTPILDFQ